MAARSLPEMAEYRQKMKLPPFVSCFIQGRTNQLTAPRVPGILLYVLLHCCTAVCSKGLVGGWVEGVLRRPSWVGESFCRWESFFVLWEMNIFFLFLKYRPPTGAWEYHRPHCCTPLSFTTVRTAALPYCCPVIISLF